MYSQKNRNKSFIYEEEIDQLNRERSSKRPTSGDISFLESHPEFKDLTLKVQSEEIKLDTEKINFLFSFLKENTKEIRKKKLILPKWIEKNYLEIYFALLSNIKIPKLELPHIKKVLSLCDYFKNEELTSIVLNEYVLPGLDKFSCVKILRDFSERLEQDQQANGNVYFDIVEKAYEMASKNIFFLINNQQSDMALLKEELIENVIERYFRSVNLKTVLDHSLIMRLMINLRKLNDIFDLLENERRKSLSNFESHLDNGLIPINWKVNSLDTLKYRARESDEFTYENISFCVITSYDNESDLYQISIKITKVATDEGSDGEGSNIIFSILSMFEVREINFKSKINFTCVYNNSSTKTLIAKIDNFSKLLPQDPAELNLKIYLSLSYNFSAIVSHICKNFYEYHSLPSISRIPKTLLNLILRNKYLNVHNEDEKLYSIINYLTNRQSSSIENVEDLFSSIRWKKVSLDGLLEFILNESKFLLSSVRMQEVLVCEFRRRFLEENFPLNQSTEEEAKSRSPSVRNLNPISRSKEKIPAMSPLMGSFTNELVLKLIKIASRYESQYKNSAYSGNNTTSSNTNSNINSQSNYHHKMHYISGQNSSRNTCHGANDSKTPLGVFAEINTSPTISEHSYLKRKQYSNKPTLESNIDKGRRSPWRNNFIKNEKFALKSASKSQNHSKPISTNTTPKKNRERSVQPQQSQSRPSNADRIQLSNSSNNLSVFFKRPQPMNYNKIYQKLKARSGSLNNVISNSVSYGSSRQQKLEDAATTDRKKRNIIDSVFNSLMSSNTGGNSNFRIKDGYSKNAATISTRPFDLTGNNRYGKKSTTARPKSANIINQ